MKAAPALLMLLPALVLLPLGVVLPGLIHGGGWDLLGRFLMAALTPSLDPQLLSSLLEGLGVTAALALVGWSVSFGLGLVLGVASSRLCWTTLSGSALPAVLLRRLLAIPRSIHELIWGLLLLQVYGLRPAVALAAIAIPYSALVARVVSDLLDAQPTGTLEALRAAGAPPGPSLITALGPSVLPGVISYGGYRLECALRSATLLGVFGLGGLGTDLRLSLQSLAFRDLWSGLWLLLALMLTLEACLGRLRHRWSVPRRLGLAGGRPGARGMEILAGLGALAPLTLMAGRALGVAPLPAMTLPSPLSLPSAGWASVLGLPWPQLVGGTLLLTLVSAALAVGLVPLQLLLTAAAPWGRVLVRATWVLGRLWPPPLTALLLLFLLKPGVVTAALALAFHNAGILGRLLLEALEDSEPSAEEALLAAGSGAGPALLYGRLSAVAEPYLAYGAYRSDVMLRETVVVSLVGVTGLGSQLMESLSSFAWDQIVAVVAVYGLLTLAGEELSDRFRRRWLGRHNGSGDRSVLLDPAPASGLR